MQVAPKYRGICLEPLREYLKRSKKSYWISALVYLLREAHKIDILMQFHFLIILSISVIFISCYTLRGSCILNVMGKFGWTIFKNIRGGKGFKGSVETLFGNSIVEEG